MQTELKPCPFCGGEAKLYDLMCDDDKADWVEWYIECTACHNHTDDDMSKTFVIEVWNKGEVADNA